MNQIGMIQTWWATRNTSRPAIPASTPAASAARAGCLAKTVSMPTGRSGTACIPACGTLSVMNDKVHLLSQGANVTELCGSVTPARFNDYEVHVNRIKGEYVWHSHRHRTL